VLGLQFRLCQRRERDTDRVIGAAGRRRGQDIRALAGQPVYLHLRFEHPFWARPQLCTLAGCQRAAELEFLWFGAFAGIVLLVLALHLVLFGVFRERDHLLYALCLAGAAGYVLVGTGMVARLIAPLGFSGYFWGSIATLAVTSIFSALFARSFLQVERASRFANRLLLAYAAAGAGLLLTWSGVRGGISVALGAKDVGYELRCVSPCAFDREYTRALGLELDARGFGMGMRGKRFALVLENGVVKQVHVEAPGEFKVSSADYILGQLA